MKFSLKALLGVLVVASVFSTGCVVDPVPTCTSNVANLTVRNYSDETVRLQIVGPTNATYNIADDTQRTDSLVAGTYRVTATGLATGLILSDSTSYFACDSSYDLTLTPGIITEPPYDAELDIANDTNENLLIYIDSEFQNRLFPGQIGQYLMQEGLHTVRVVQESTNQTLHQSTEYFYSGFVVTWSITSTHPEIEIHNNLYASEGDFPECLNTFVDTFAVNFSTDQAPIWDVCPAEIGYFAVYNGERLIEVFGQDSSFQYVDLFQYFPENTTTIIDVD